MTGLVEDRALECYLDQLAKTLDPVTCSTRLLEAEVIDEQAWDEARVRGVADYDRNLTVLKAVRKRVRADAAYFYKFCDVLEKEEYTKFLSKTIQDEVKKKDLPQETKPCADTNAPPLDPAQGLKRKHTCAARGEDTAKRRRVVKSGIIESEKVLMDIAREISSKWEEVGVYLGLTSKEIRNELSSETGQSLNKKAFHMLLVWQEKAEDEFTYATLAKALEAAGLNSASIRHTAIGMILIGLKINCTWLVYIQCSSIVLAAKIRVDTDLLGFCFP